MSMGRRGASPGGRSGTRDRRGTRSRRRRARGAGGWTSGRSWIPGSWSTSILSSKLDSETAARFSGCQVCFTPPPGFPAADNDGMNESRDLFTGAGNANVPLAERLRPKSVADMVGQEHLLGEGRALWVALRAGKPHSMILWGPPGVGKTTLARLMAQAFNADFLAISAELSGVKGNPDAADPARPARDQFGRST